VLHGRFVPQQALEPMLDSIERMFDQVNPDPWRPGTRGGPEE
jgi:hypothetical protein